MTYQHNLKVHNTLSREKEVFTPIDAKNVRMYVCGMTVYDYCHIGHARVLVVFDLIYRYLMKVYGAEHVTYIRNVTDIDDKIIQRANENGESFKVLTNRYIEHMEEDAAKLGVLQPSEQPRATTHMDQIIAMISKLQSNGYAYAAANGDVYYDVSEFEGYGKLSGKNPDDLRAGERIAVDESKNDPLDFVLWKAAKPGEPFWESQWGKGRPGWHIECSAMSTHCLGDHFDIHGGGMDLQFPHHENEIAQSQGATGCGFVNYWIHNGFVRVDDEKMSKSLGNFFTIREVLKKYDAEVIRYFILTSHYRSPLNYSDKHLDHAKGALTTLYNALRDITVAGSAEGEVFDNYRHRLYSAMDDDFNTAEALALLFELAHEINRYRDTDPALASTYAALLKEFGEILGLLQRDAVTFLKGGDSKGDDVEIDQLIIDRNQARADKNWAEADRIRDELQARNIVLEDGAGGTSWRRG